MKNNLIALLFAINAFCSYAQDIPTTLVKSEIFKDEYKNSNIVDVAEDGNGGVLVIRSYQGGLFSRGVGYYFEHYDAKLKLLKEDRKSVV